MNHRHKHTPWFNSCKFSSTVIPNAMYKIYSINTPATQSYLLNFCIKYSDDLKAIVWEQGCQYFIIHSPGIRMDPQSVSMESVCYPGFFIRQRNYKFILEKRSDSKAFGKYNRQRTWKMIGTCNKRNVFCIWHLELKIKTGVSVSY